MPVLKSQVLSWNVNEILTTCLSTGSRVVNDSLLDRKSNKPGETSITLDLDNDLCYLETIATCIKGCMKMEYQTESFDSSWF